MHPAIMKKLRDLVKSWRDRADVFSRTSPQSGEDDALRGRAEELETILNNDLAGSFYGTGETYTCLVCRTENNGPCDNLKCPIGYHNVWTRERSEDATGDGPDPLSRRDASAYAIGGVAAWEAIGPKLRDLAGREFAGGHDERARWFRDLAIDFEDEAKLKRAAYERDYKNEG